jgi:hypothetical protein
VGRTRGKQSMYREFLGKKTAKRGQLDNRIDGGGDVNITNDTMEQVVRVRHGFWDV